MERSALHPDSPQKGHRNAYVDGSDALDWKVERVMADERTLGLLTAMA
jgi:hypothetical protein